MKPRHLALAVHAAACLAALTWPGHALLEATVGLDRPVLGLPTWFAWVVAWVLATFLVLILFFRADER